MVGLRKESLKHGFPLFRENIEESTLRKGLTSAEDTVHEKVKGSPI